jgi:hypothetical protein
VVARSWAVMPLPLSLRNSVLTLDLSKEWLESNSVAEAAGVWFVPPIEVPVHVQLGTFIDRRNSPTVYPAVPSLLRQMPSIPLNSVCRL